MPSPLTCTPGRAKLLTSQAAALREVRARLGLTQEAAATICGVKIGTYRTWEHGLRQPSKAMRKAIAATWGINEQLLGIACCPYCGRAY